MKIFDYLEMHFWKICNPDNSKPASSKILQKVQSVYLWFNNLKILLNQLIYFLHILGEIISIFLFGKQTLYNVTYSYSWSMELYLQNHFIGKLDAVFAKKMLSEDFKKKVVELENQVNVDVGYFMALYTWKGLHWF